jgi:hypothetical protein
LNGFAQNDTTQLNTNFDYVVSEVFGDLNKDGISDKVLVMQDTLHQNAPYRVQIFLKNTKGKYRLMAMSTKIIEPQFPNGRGVWLTGNGYGSVSIRKGVLIINFELLRGFYEHKFRFQNGNFELIGFHMNYSDGNEFITFTDYNLITGIRIEKVERIDNEKTVSFKKRKIILKRLPHFQDIVPLENGLY